MNKQVYLVSYSAEREAIHAIRHQVFQLGQGVDPAVDFDGLDDAAIHLLARFNHEPVGTARIRFLSDRLAKIERVAVLSKCRGQGIGQQIMEVAIEFLASKGVPEVKVNAQSHAKHFYEKLGFRQWGDEFVEAGIPHVEMRRQP